MKKSNYRNDDATSATTSKELATLLDIDSPVDQALMIYKSQLSSMAVKAIDESGLSVSEIVARFHVARSKVSAIKNGALAGISSDLFIKVIAAAGSRIKLNLVS